MAVTPDTTLLPEMPRPVIEAEIERLVGLLDPDPDLDGGDGEPILGGPESRTGSWSGLYPEAYADDCEADDGDDEPSLGGTDHLNQTRWGAYAGDDREKQCEDEGARCDDEGAYNTDLENEGDGFRNYLGDCSPITLGRQA